MFNRFFLAVQVMGWVLALIFCLLWRAERRHREADPVRPIERSDAGRNSSAAWPEPRDLAPSAKASESVEAAAKADPPEKRSRSTPSLFRFDGEDRVQWSEDARGALGLSEADASTLQASTQAYLDAYRDLQKRHLDIRRFDPEQLEFFIDAFPTEGRAVREGLTSIWRRTVDPSIWSEIQDQVAGLFGGEKEGFGALRVRVTARRETDGAGSVLTTEQYFTPAGEKAGARSGLSISGDDDPQPVSEHLYHYSPLFKKR